MLTRSEHLAAPRERPRRSPGLVGPRYPGPCGSMPVVPALPNAGPTGMVEDEARSKAWNL